MRIACGLVVAFAAVTAGGLARPFFAQGTSDGSQPLVGTWQLTRLERTTDTQPLAQVANPVGMLIQDANGHVIEIVSRAARPSTLDAAEQFMTYQAFWGTYTVDASRSTAAYRIDGDLNPGRAGQRLMRSFERNGTQLVLTESALDGRPASRTTWQRIPELEGLPAYQEDIVGFWQWTSAGLLNSSGANVRPAYRDASVIVYTPTGHMAVLYLPPPGRKPFVGTVPTVEEARAATQGSVSYFGTYIVQPKSRAVFHYQLGAANPTAVGGSFMRNFEIAGAQVTLRFPPTTLNGQQVQNVLTLKRLSGLADMWPDFRR
jgi:Lipocalin-like domain